MKSSDDNIDKSIRQLFHEELPRERRDEWFVKKVMNRLPNRRKPTFSRPELISFVLSALMLLSGWIWLWRKFNLEDALTYSSLAMAGALIVMTFGLLGLIVVPILQRN